jgi:hypothetical protein
MERTLGPRDVGGILKETFTIYKNNFWRLAAVISIVAIPSGILGIFFNLLSPSHGEMTTAALMKGIIWIIISLPLSIATFVVSFLMVGAVIHAISEQYLKRPIDIGRAYRFSWHRLGGMIGAVLLFGLAIIGIWIVAIIVIMIAAVIGKISQWLGVLLPAGILILICLSAIIYLSIIWNFMFQAALVEGCGPTAALSRSKTLVKQSWWRVFGIILLFYVIVAAIMIILYAPAITGYITWALSRFTTGDITAATSQPPTSTLILLTIGALIGNIIATPLFATGQTLLYFDLRVRKQGYTLDALANELGLTNAPTGTGASLPE